MLISSVLLMRDQEIHMGGKSVLKNQFPLILYVRQKFIKYYPINISLIMNIAYGLMGTSSLGEMCGVLWNNIYRTLILLHIIIWGERTKETVSMRKRESFCVQWIMADMPDLMQIKYDARFVNMKLKDIRRTMASL